MVRFQVVTILMLFSQSAITQEVDVKKWVVPLSPTERYYDLKAYDLIFILTNQDGQTTFLADANATNAYKSSLNDELTAKWAVLPIAVKLDLVTRFTIIGNQVSLASLNIAGTQHITNQIIGYNNGVAKFLAGDTLLAIEAMTDSIWEGVQFQEELSVAQATVDYVNNQLYDIQWILMQY